MANDTFHGYVDAIYLASTLAPALPEWNDPQLPGGRYRALVAAWIAPGWGRLLEFLAEAVQASRPLSGQTPRRGSSPAADGPAARSRGATAAAGPADASGASPL